MFLNTVSDFAIYHFKNDKSNKVWGMFKTEDQVWVCFWGGVGMNVSFKKHGHTWQGQSGVRSARDQKVRKGYRKIELDAIVNEWKDFESMMMERFTWFKLSDLASSL